MPASSSIRRVAPTPEQSRLLVAYRDRWADIRFGCRRGNRAAAEAGVQLAYAAVGLPSPNIVWCEGPIELAAAWERARASRSAGANVRSLVVDAMHERARAAMARLDLHDTTTILVGVRDLVADTAGTGAVEAVTRHAKVRRPPLRLLMRDAVSRLTRLESPFNGGPAFARASTSSYELGWLAPYDFLREVCGLEPETECLRGLTLIAANASWFVPYERICWLAARHAELLYDAKGRLHNATGPALAFADGWSFYAWKGIEVPRDAIECPEALTVEQIDTESSIVVRRCLIEIITPRRYVALGGASRVGEDDTGVLWHKTWWTGDTWAAVEVVDGTPGPDGTRKHYFLQVPPELRTPRAAVAWSYGVSEQQYARLELRT